MMQVNKMYNFTEQRVPYQDVKPTSQFKTSYNLTQLLLCTLYYSPADDPLRSKHDAKLNI